MMLFKVRVTYRHGDRVEWMPEFVVLMYREPGPAPEDVEQFHDEVRNRVRQHHGFRAHQERLPAGYRMDLDVLSFDPNFVTCLEE